MTRPDRDAKREEAADQLIRAVSAGRRAEHDLVLHTWRRRDTENEAAYLEISRTWDDAAKLRAHPRYAELLGAPSWRERWVAFRDQLSERLQPARGPAWAAFASAALVLATSLLWLGMTPGGTDYVTRTAEVRNLPLEDGSMVTLGARSALEVRLNGDVRRATLVEGEAFFAVAKNEARPFLVAAGDTVIRVVGTKFNVNYRQGRVRVSVLEGAVDVTRSDAAGGATTVRLTAGLEAVDAVGLARPQVAGPAVVAAGSWRDGRLSYEGASLADIVADANRYRAAEIRIVSPELANVRITTSFGADQIDQMLDGLPDMLPVKVHRYPDGRVELAASDG